MAADRETAAQGPIQPRVNDLHTHGFRTSADEPPPDGYLQIAAADELDEKDSLMIGRVVLSALLTTSSAAAFAADSSGDSVSGKAIFQHICQNCHSTEIGINKVGPSLWGVVGREPASVLDYTYSKAMKANKSAWTAAALDAYLADPRGDVHGAKMFFKGLPESRDRADVIAYLTTLK